MTSRTPDNSSTSRLAAHIEITTTNDQYAQLATNLSAIIERDNIPFPRRRTRIIIHSALDNGTTFAQHNVQQAIEEQSDATIVVIPYPGEQEALLDTSRSVKSDIAATLHIVSTQRGTRKRPLVDEVITVEGTPVIAGYTDVPVTIISSIPLLAEAVTARFQERLLEMKVVTLEHEGFIDYAQKMAETLGKLAGTKALPVIPTFSSTKYLTEKDRKEYLQQQIGKASVIFAVQSIDAHTYEQVLRTLIHLREACVKDIYLVATHGEKKVIDQLLPLVDHTIITDSIPETYTASTITLVPLAETIAKAIENSEN